MSDDKSTPLVLSRQELYSLVWSTPLRQLASRLGMSEKGIATRCMLLEIPMPSQRWWGRTNLGRAPSGPGLPAHEPRMMDPDALRFSRSTNAGPLQKATVSLAVTEISHRDPPPKAWRRKRTRTSDTGQSEGQPRDHTFREAAAKYLQEHPNRRAAERYTPLLQRLIPFIGALPLRRVHHGTLRPFIDARLAAGLCPGTVNMDLAVVRRILQQCARLWRDEAGEPWLQTAPSIQMLPHPHQREPFPLSVEEERLLFSELPDHLVKLATFTLNTGCGEREVAELRWSWEVQVPELGTSVFVIPSFGKSRLNRHVVLNKIAKLIIESCRGDHKELVFTRRGKPVGRIYKRDWPLARRRAAERYSRKFGLPCPEGFKRISAHDLKATYDHRLRAAGVGFEDRQVLLGHTSDDTTTHYSAAEIGTLIAASERVYELACCNSPSLAVMRAGAPIKDTTLSPPAVELTQGDPTPPQHAARESITRIAGPYRRGDAWRIVKQMGDKRRGKSPGADDVGDPHFLVRLPDHTFREAASKYLDENQDKRSIDQDARMLPVLMPHIGELPLRRVHHGTLQPFIKARLAAGMSPDSVNRELATVRLILNLSARAWRDEAGRPWLHTAPLIRKLRNPNRREPYPLSIEEERLLFSELPDHLARMATFKVNTGCREQEVVNLLWCWEVPVPEFNTSVFVIPRDLVKNGRDRYVILNRIAKSVIERCRGDHRVSVFTRYGKPLGNIYNSSWQSARWRAAERYRQEFGRPCPDGFRYLRVHDLKHTYGHRLRAAGVGFEDRMLLLGHALTHVTTYYSAAEIGALIAASDRVCELAGRNSPILAIVRAGR
jgi:integrase